MSTLNVAMIGQGFMGRSHSNAWGQVGRFFDPPMSAVMHTVFGQEAENPQVFADRWGWQNASTDWEATINSPDVGLVDIVTPNFMHAPPAKAAIGGMERALATAPIRAEGRRSRAFMPSECAAGCSVRFTAPGRSGPALRARW